jgi:hypothetical protein
MKHYKEWHEEEVYPVDRMYEVDTVKLIKYCRHFEKLNRSLSNDLSRDDCQREIDNARADSYAHIIFNIRNNLLVTKTA